jgi:hypothetical protein
VEESLASLIAKGLGFSWVRLDAQPLEDQLAGGITPLALVAKCWLFKSPAERAKTLAPFGIAGTAI